MVEGEHEYGLVDEDGWQIVRVPKGFEEALVHLHESLKERAPHITSDGNAIFLREIRIERAQEMLQLAIEAYHRKEISHAWYFLTEVAECIGFLVASQGAVRSRGDDEDLRSSLRTAGRKGGRAKGENAQQVLESIVRQILAKQPPEGGWNKKLMRREYNNITAGLSDYKDSDRKWQALWKREDIQRALLKPAQ